MRTIKTTSSSGFTLLELMATVMIAAIIAAFAVPSFQEMIEKTRIRTTAQGILEAFRLARLTAAEERIQVVICTRAASGACGGNSDWGSGIIAYKDMNASGTWEAGEDIIVSEIFSPHVNVINARSNDLKITIRSSGWTPGEQTSLLICNNRNTNRNGYRIVLNNAGRVTSIPSEGDNEWTDSSGNTFSCVS